jgi:hypothetical protein
MATARLDRVALVVSDVTAVAEDLKAIFDMDITLVEAESLGIRAGLGNDGIELVDKIGDTSPLEKFWRPPLAALVVRCDDIDATTAKMEAGGFVVDHRVTTKAGLREVSFGNSFHGIPLTLYESATDDLMDAVVGDESLDEYAPDVAWETKG